MTMKTIASLSLILSLTFVIFSGCTGRHEDPKVADNATPPATMPDQTNEETAIQANIAKLSPEDRKLAEEQHFCAVETKSRLGSMGAPHKVMLKGQPVFLCCDGCETKAKAHADRTLAKVQQLRAKKAQTTDG
jgi:hypothetical protein